MSSYSDYPPPLPPLLTRPSHSRTLSNSTTSSSDDSNPPTTTTTTFSPTRSPRLKNPNLNEMALGSETNGGGESGSNPSPSRSSRPTSPEQKHSRSVSPTSARSRQASLTNEFLTALPNTTSTSSSKPYGSPTVIVQPLPYDSTSPILKTSPYVTAHNRFNSNSNTSPSTSTRQQASTFGFTGESRRSSPVTQSPRSPNTLDGKARDEGASSPATPWTPTRKSRTHPFSTDAEESSEKLPPSTILDYGIESTSTVIRRTSNSTPSSVPIIGTPTLHHRRSSGNLRKLKLPSLDLSGSLFTASGLPISPAVASTSDSSDSPRAYFTPDSEVKTLRSTQSFGSATTAKGGDESFEGEEGEARRIRKARRLVEVKEKNQRILDSINSQPLSPNSTTSLLPQASSLHYNHDESSPHLEFPQSTTPTLVSSPKSPALHPLPSLTLSGESEPLGGGSTSSSGNRGIRPRASMSELGGRYDETGTRRKVSEGSHDRERERERRMRTLGRSHNSGGMSPSSSDLGEDPSHSQSQSGSGSSKVRKPKVEEAGGGKLERSSTSMSSARRKSGWLDREYERSKSSVGKESQVREERESYSSRRIRTENSSPNDHNYRTSMIESDDSRRRMATVVGSPLTSTLDEIRRSPTMTRIRPSLPQDFVSNSTLSPLSDRDRTLSPRTQSNLSPRLNHNNNISSLEPTNTRRWASQPDSSPRHQQQRHLQGGGEEEEQLITPTISTPSRALPSSSSPWGRANPNLDGILLSSGSGKSGHLGVPSPRYDDGVEGEEPVENSQRALSRARSSARLRSQMAEESSRIEKEDVFRNGLKFLDKGRNNSMDDQFDTNEPLPEIERRGSRTKGSEIGSDTWLQDFHDTRARNSLSRASMHDDSLSPRHHATSLPPPPQTPHERDGTIRAINAVLAAQGLVVAPAPHTAPSRLGSRHVESENIRRRAMSNEFDSPNSSNGAFARPISRAESSRSTRSTTRNGSIGTAEHHRVLLQALDHLDNHFNPAGDGEILVSESSVDLVKRMTGLVNSTTKLNLGLRALSIAATEAQIDAALDEGRRSSISELVQFEKSVNFLVRSSDDQIRSLTEGLIVFTKVDREKDRLNGDGIRPISRAGMSSRSAFSPKRVTNSGVFEGGAATVSTSASRTTSRSAPRPLRNPLDEPRRAGALSVSGQSSSQSNFAAHADSPTPSSRNRRHLESSLSPLSINDRESSTPSRTLSTSSVARRSKSSAAINSTRAITPSSNPQPMRFPRSSLSTTAPVIDSTNASSIESPTKSRYYSENDRTTYEALGIDTQGSQDNEREWNYHHRNSGSVMGDESGSSPEVIKSPLGARYSLSSGAVGLGQGANFRTALTSPRLNRGGGELMVEVNEEPEVDRRQERRREIVSSRTGTN